MVEVTAVKTARSSCREAAAAMKDDDEEGSSSSSSDNDDLGPTEAANCTEKYRPPPRKDRQQEGRIRTLSTELLANPGRVLSRTLPPCTGCVWTPIW